MNPNDPFETTEAIVLKKTKFSESSLIFTTLTSHNGKQQFIVKGAQGFKKKPTPFIDLLRHLRITYKSPSKQDLITIREVDLIQSFESVASKPANFRAAMWLCDFINKNTQINEKVPNLFLALEAAFSRLASHDFEWVKPSVLGVCFVMLSDNGLLPDFSDDEHSKSGVTKMLNFALNHDYSHPHYPETTWDDLLIWIKTHIQQHTTLTLPKMKL